MLGEIIAGRKYRRRDGVIVEAVFGSDADRNYYGGTLITVKVAGSNLENDGTYRWKKDGPKPGASYSGWEDMMVAGQCPRTTHNLARLNPLDLVECLDIPGSSIFQMELF